MAFLPDGSAVPKPDAFIMRDAFTKQRIFIKRRIYQAVYFYQVESSALPFINICGGRYCRKAQAVRSIIKKLFKSFYQNTVPKLFLLR